MFCFKCGEDNPPLANFCNRCNAKLPKFSSNVAPSITAPKTERLMKMLDLANKALDGIIPAQDLLDDIEKQEKSIETIANKFRNMPLHKSLKSEFKPQLDMALKGMDAFLGCLKTIKDAMQKDLILEDEQDMPEDGVYFELSEESQNAIMEAIDIAKEGNEYLNRSFEMSEESVRKVREESIMYEDDSSIL